MKYILKDVKENCTAELEILERDTTLFDKIINGTFPRLTYDYAVDVLKGKEKINGKTTIETLEKRF